MRKLLEIFFTITGMIALIVVPPATGTVAYALWQQAPLPFETPTIATIASVWTTVVVAALIKQGLDQ